MFGTFAGEVSEEEPITKVQSQIDENDEVFSRKPEPPKPQIPVQQNSINQNLQPSSYPQNFVPLIIYPYPYSQYPMVSGYNSNI